MFSSSQLVVGVDLGGRRIIKKKIKRTDKAYSIVTIGSAVLPEGAVDDGALVEPEVVASAISNLFKNLKIKHKKVGISISGYSVIVKKVNLAVMSEKDMEDHIMAEAEQYIPFDIQDVYLDFQDLKTNKDGYERTDVMLVAAKKEIVDDYLSMLESIGLQTTIVDIDGFALENTYEYNTPKSENVALIDIGASKMNINIISKGMSVVARDIVVGSRQLTERIMGQFDLQFEEIFSSVCTQWILEIKKAIDLYHSNFPDAPLTRLVLSGGGSKVAGLTDYLNQETGIEVERFNPFTNMKSSKRKIDPEYLQLIGPEMAIASGIAIRPSAI